MSGDYEVAAGTVTVDSVRFNADGLVPAVVQDHVSDEVLMLAWLSRESLEATLRDGLVTYWSRSRSELWRKGDTSGHYQHLRSIAVDCDGDTLLLRVEQIGAACHTGSRSCFDGREIAIHTQHQGE